MELPKRKPTRLPDFDYNAMCKAATNEIKYLTKYIQCTTPMLMYEFDDISPLINTIRRHDRLKDRQAEMDADMTRFHSLENIYESFTKATQGTPFAKLNDTTQIAILGGIKSELKKLVYRFIVRIRDLKGEFPGTAQKRLFDEYVQYLYWQHSGNEMELLQLYDATQNAVLSWDGQFDSDTICIDDSNNRFWVLEQLQIEPLPYMRDPEDGEILRFSTTLKLRFQKENSDVDTAEISMDYALFEMISAMREGYRPTVQDKNQHTDFVSFVQRLIEFGNKATRIILIPKDGDQNNRYIFEKKAFGFSFKVV
jgi:DNA phosphorothioation-dependent restriction protein DptF